MFNRVLLATVIALCSCNQRSQVKRNADTGHEALSIPFKHAAGFRDGYLLLAPREGPFLWNGTPVEGATVSDWVRQYAQRRGAGRLWIEFEPGVSAQRRHWLRQQVIDSGLCQQRRCVETDWNAEWSVVN